MTAPYLVACLATLRAEFNELAPDRDKGSDGWIGDEAHQHEVSDHNPDSQGRVLAVDIDSTGPWPYDFTAMVESLRGDSRLEYIIWNRRIASRDQGWTWRTYTGTSDPHTGHAHFSARHDHTGNTSTASWLEDFMPLNDADLAKIQAIVNAGRTDTDKTALVETPEGHAVLSQQIPNGTKPGSPQDAAYNVIRDLGLALVALQETVDEIAAKVNG